MADDATVRRELEQLPWQAELTPAQLDALAALGELEELASGETLFELGAPADALRFVLDGRIALFLSDPRRQDRTIGTASTGDLLGWSTLRRDGATWTVSARAARPSRCAAFPAGPLLALCGRDLAFGAWLMQHAFEAMARRLTDARLQLLDVYGNGG